MGHLTTQRCLQRQTGLPGGFFDHLFALFQIEVAKLIPPVAHQRFMDSVVKLLADQVKKVRPNRKEKLHGQIGVVVAISDEAGKRFALSLRSEVNEEFFELIANDNDLSPQVFGD